MSSTATATQLSSPSHRLEPGELRLNWQELWHGSADARERLILHYVPLVSFAARRLAGVFSPAVDRQDLIAAGVIGLIEAIERFDPERGVQFETFALHRVRGAMVDELRKLDWVPQSLRAKTRELDRASAKLSPALRRAPDEAELASAVGCDVRDVRRRVEAATRGRLVALEALAEPECEAAVPVASSAAGDAVREQPGAGIEAEEMRDALKDAIDELDERDRRVIVLSYVEDLTLARIGEIIGVCESRVSQIRSRIFKRLRERLAEYVED